MNKKVIGICVGILISAGTFIFGGFLSEQIRNGFPLILGFIFIAGTGFFVNKYSKSYSSIGTGMLITLPIAFVTFLLMLRMC